MSLYEEVVDIVTDYLGPAAERYIKRQVDFHMEKSAEELTKEDVGQMAEWVRSSLGLLTQDKKMVDECADRLVALSTG